MWLDLFQISYCPYCKFYLLFFFLISYCTYSKFYSFRFLFFFWFHIVNFIHYLFLFPYCKFCCWKLLIVDGLEIRAFPNSLFFSFFFLYNIYSNTVRSLNTVVFFSSICCLIPCIFGITNATRLLYSTIFSFYVCVQSDYTCSIMIAELMTFLYLWGY